MDLKDDEVLITLTPLGAPEEVTRRLKINETTKQIDVGRASKNAEKGLVAAEDNAWFDSPIMSRQHAKFSATANKKAYLQDNDSTHGTYLGNLRLKAYEDYAVTNDDIITFGVRVTSGDRTYLAKEFRVNIEWRPFRRIMLEQITSSILGDQISPIMLGRPVNTLGPRISGFHVPNDDENDSSLESSRASSVRVLGSRVRAYSVPSSEECLTSSEDELEPSYSKELRLPKSPNTVLKPTNEKPYRALERGLPSLLDRQEQVGPSETRLFNTSSLNVNEIGYPHLNLSEPEEEPGYQKVVPSSDCDDTESLKPESCRPESQSTETEPQVEDSCYDKATKKPADESVSADEEEIGVPSYYGPYFDHYSSTLGTYTPQATPGDPRPRNDTKFYSDGTNISKSSEAETMDLTETAVAMNGKYVEAHPLANCRPPSPSDAALAKKASSLDQRSYRPLLEDSQIYASGGDSSPHQMHSNKTYGLRRQNEIFDSVDGPGNNRPGTFVDRSLGFGPERAPANSPLMNAVASTSTLSAHFSLCSQDSCIDNDVSSIVSLNASPQPDHQVRHQPKQNENHTSRLTISNIVHPHVECTRKLKRKADEISVDEPEPQINEDSGEEFLQDAQLRDTIVANESHSIEGSSKISRIAETVLQPPHSGTSNPPQKRLKTSISTAIGIGKFVSGVCFGVAGAFAAFIATIPLSVQEEAMQELVMSA